MAWASVGVDLAGSPRRYTGLCKMDFNLYCESCLSKEDHEILEFIYSSDPQVVAIDAPLSLPRHGQTLRSCDRKLVEMGIHIFPPTLFGMKILAERAMRLREQLEASGYTVIEVYPGGAQDLLGLPRKGKGIHLLKEGLIKIGVKGLRCNESGHELDAVTCSLTGIAYLKKKYIEVGDPDDCVVILPCLEMFLNENEQE